MGTTNGVGLDWLTHSVEVGMSKVNLEAAFGPVLAELAVEIGDALDELSSLSYQWEDESYSERMTRAGTVALLDEIVEVSDRIEWLRDRLADVLEARNRAGKVVGQ